MRQKLALPVILILLAALASGYFSYRLASAFYSYFPLVAQTEAHIVRWEVKEMKGKFLLKAFYSFDTGEKKWNGSTVLSSLWHLNEGSAIATLKDVAKKKWEVWFDPSKPSHSSLEKEFPAGLLCRALISYSLLFYFVFIFRKILNNFAD